MAAENKNEPNISKDNPGGKNPNEKPKNFKAALCNFAVLLKPHKLSFLTVAVSSVFTTVMSVFGPRFLGNIIDILQRQVNVKLGGGQMSFEEIISALLQLFAVYTVSVIATYIQYYVMAGVVQKVVYNMRQSINSKLSRLPLSYFDGYTKGEILSRVTNDIENINLTLQNNLTQIITSVVTLAGVLIMMLLLSVRMTLIFLSIIPFCLIVASVIASHSKRYFRRQWDCAGDINSHIEEMYTSHKIIKAFDCEEKAIEKFDSLNEELFSVSKKAQFISGMIPALLGFLNNIGYVMICVAGGVYVAKKAITLGDVVSFITYSTLFTHPISNLSNIVNSLQSSLASGERIFEMLGESEEPADSKNARLEKIVGNIRFEGVDFSYDKSKKLIENLNLDIKSGQVVAIVGKTGSGKTTLVNLLMRFYDVNGGRITLDGVDIRDIPRETLRSAFGMVLQDAWLFKGTVMENLKYGMSNADDEQVFAAAKSARANHFIATLSDGYDTMLEEEGANISQGQRQLLTIARAVLTNPPALILDEATSSVDTRTESIIQKAMNDLMKGRTSFVIAHRLSTIRDADIILVMDGGAIVEKGSHSELIEKNGVYARLYKSQFAG